MSKPHTPDLGSDFPDYSLPPQDNGAASLAAAAVQHETGPKTEPIPIINIDAGTPKDTHYHPEGLGRKFNTTLEDAIQPGKDGNLPLLGRQARPTAAPSAPDEQPPQSTELTSKESFWHKKATKIGGGILALALIAGATIATINPWKKDGADQENAGATPPAATAGSLGVDTPKTSSLNTEANTATVQAQPTEAPQSVEVPQTPQEALSPAEAFLAKGVAAGTGGIAVNEILPGGEAMVTYHVRDKELITHFVPSPDIATAQQLATRELDLLGAYLSTSNEDEAQLLLETLTPDLPKNTFATYLKGERANKQATANTDPNGAMLVTFGSNPNNPAVFTKSTKINANGDPITTVTLVGGELYQQSRYVPAIEDVDAALNAPYTPSLTAPVTSFTFTVQPRFNSDGSAGDFQTDIGIKYGPNMDQPQN